MFCNNNNKNRNEKAQALTSEAIRMKLQPLTQFNYYNTPLYLVNND